tara:strand:- start:76 stop:201 length:126 start_codon:yes stop_codon:yes gene_type:complete
MILDIDVNIGKESDIYVIYDIEMKIEIVIDIDIEEKGRDRI